MKASEACEISDINYSKKDDIQLDEIYSQIKSTAEKGLYRLEYKIDFLSKKVYNTLTEQGYIVTANTFDKGCYLIMWST